MTRTLFSLLSVASSLSAGEAIHQASEARLWLTVPANQPPLRDIHVSPGVAAAATWEKDPEARERRTDIRFPVRWWMWSTETIRFTPVADGTVELSLCGPWAADENGAMPRQEILWDDITAEGTEIKNGGFEETTENRPASWTSPWAPYPAADSWPLAGTAAMSGNHLAASWCNRPLVQNLAVKAGQTVTLHLHAKAATPPGFIAPKLLGNNTPAHRALAGLKRGVNLGNGWEAPAGSWGQHFTTEDIDHIAAEGFDHIRVPVAFHFYLKPVNGGLELDPALLAQLEPVLRRALDKKLRVLLDWHNFTDLTNAPAENTDRFVAGWDAIARHFQSWPPGLFFELFNEPCDALTTEVANPIYQKTIAAIRETNPARIIVVSPGQWGQIGQLEKLRLPDQDERIVVTVHCYEPFQFTHQGAGWVGFQNLRGVVYPGPPASPLAVPDSLKDNAGVRAFLADYNTLPAERNPCSPRVIREALDTARAWSLHFGRPVHLGEFGAHNVGDDASRGRYLHDVKTLAEERGIPWTMWEWKSSFGYWDPKANQPRFRKSIFE